MVEGDERTKLIYILGSGRSGSTLLDRILGEHQDIVNLGEICHFGDFYTQNKKCACCVPIRDCPFWKRVVISLEKKFDTSVNTIDLGFPSKRIPSKIVMFYDLLLCKTSNRPKSFNDHYINLFSAIKYVTGAEFILDSSKDPFRLHYLIEKGNFDVYVVHLIRDPRAVVFSRSKTKEQLPPGTLKNPSLKKAAMIWVLRNVLSEWVKRRIPPSRKISVRYEDLCANPDEVLLKLTTFLEIRPLSVRSLEPYEPLHNIGGNRMRFKPITDIRVDDRWRSYLTLKEKRLVHFICMLLKIKYGYK